MKKSFASITLLLLIAGAANAGQYEDLSSDILGSSAGDVETGYEGSGGAIEKLAPTAAGTLSGADEWFKLNGYLDVKN